MVFNTYFNPFTTSKLVNKSVFNNFSRILIKIGIYDFERNQKSGFHPIWPQNFVWSASWKVFVLEYLTPTWGISGTSGSIISGQKIQSHFFGFDDVIPDYI